MVLILGFCLVTLVSFRGISKDLHWHPAAKEPEVQLIKKILRLDFNLHQTLSCLKSMPITIWIAHDPSQHSVSGARVLQDQREPSLRGNAFHGVADTFDLKPRAKVQLTQHGSFQTFQTLSAWTTILISEGELSPTKTIPTNEMTTSIKECDSGRPLGKWMLQK